MSKITLKYTGGKAKGRKYSDGVNECDLTDPKSCIIVIDEEDAVRKLRDHGDKFEVIKGEEGILSLLETAKIKEVKMNEAVGGKEVKEVKEKVVETTEDIEEKVEAEPTPDDTWSKTKIRKWLKIHDTKSDTKDEVGDLLELVAIVLESDEEESDEEESDEEESDEEESDED